MRIRHRINKVKKGKLGISSFSLLFVMEVNISSKSFENNEIGIVKRFQEKFKESNVLVECIN